MDLTEEDTEDAREDSPRETPRRTPAAVVDPDELDELSAVLDEGEDADAATCSVYRLHPNEKPGYLFKCPVPAFSIDRLRDEFGGGSFRVFVRDARQRIRARRDLRIEAPRMPPSSPVDVRPQVQDAPNAIEVQLSGLTRAVEALLAAQVRQAQAAPALTEDQMLERMLRYKQLFGTPPASGSGGEAVLAAFTQGMEMAGRFADDSREKSTTDILHTAVAEFAPALAQIVSGGGARAATAPATTPATEDAMQMHELMRYRAQIRQLCAKAARGADPALYADLLLDEFGPDAVGAMVTNPDIMTRLVSLEPAVAQHESWFHSLLEQLKAALDDTDGDSKPDPALDT